MLINKKEITAKKSKNKEIGTEKCKNNTRSVTPPWNHTIWHSLYSKHDEQREMCQSESQM